MLDDEAQKDIETWHAKNDALAFIGKMLILGMPKLMKAIGIICIIAMLMVGGGILLHNLPFLHDVVHLGSSLPQVMELFITPVIAALIGGGLIILVKGWFK